MVYTIVGLVIASVWVIDMFLSKRLGKKEHQVAKSLVNVYRELYAPAVELFENRDNKTISQEEFELHFNSLMIAKGHLAVKEELRDEIKQWLTSSEYDERILFRLRRMFQLACEASEFVKKKYKIV